MTVAYIVFTSLATVASALFFMLRLFTFRVILRHSWIVDILFHIVLVSVFYGTLGGIGIAVLATLIMSILLTGARSAQRFARFASTHLKGAAVAKAG